MSLVVLHYGHCEPMDGGPIWDVLDAEEVLEDVCFAWPSVAKMSDHDGVELKVGDELR
jgi:hypothetical protein